MYIMPEPSSMLQSGKRTYAETVLLRLRPLNETVTDESTRDVMSRTCISVCQCVAVCVSVLQCVSVCCSVCRCVAVCVSVLQCVAVCIVAV